MRTTVTIDDDLLDSAKHLAIQQGRTVGSVLEDGIRLLLARRDQGPAERIRLTVFSGPLGLRPGVDLDDKDALYELLDADEPDEDD